MARQDHNCTTRPPTLFVKRVCNGIMPTLSDTSWFCRYIEDKNGKKRCSQTIEFFIDSSIIRRLKIKINVKLDCNLHFAFLNVYYGTMNLKLTILSNYSFVKKHNPYCTVRHPYIFSYRVSMNRHSRDIRTVTLLQRTTRDTRPHVVQLRLGVFNSL